MNNKGKVYIAGAGCGNEGLITVKLKSVLEKAECIIYDRLVNESILQYVKPAAELIYMGKENMEGGELQKQINEMMVKKSMEGLTVLRLKGGDPFVFGRGGEEIEALIAENIDFEVIPGISSKSIFSAIRASISSPPRPNTKGSPPLSLNTVSPSLLFSTIISFIFF